MNKIPEELKQQIIEEFVKTLDNKLVAAKFGISTSSVTSITKQARKSIILTCPVCGIKFPYKQGKKYCSELCQVENQRKIYRYKKNEAELIPEEPKKPKKTLRELAIEAREHGMSYGKYVLMLEQQKEV